MLFPCPLGDVPTATDENQVEAQGMLPAQQEEETSPEHDFCKAATFWHIPSPLWPFAYHGTQVPEQARGENTG